MNLNYILTKRFSLKTKSFSYICSMKELTKAEEQVMDYLWKLEKAFCKGYSRTISGTTTGLQYSFHYCKDFRKKGNGWISCIW